jgi:hypothetical protein
MLARLLAQVLVLALLAGAGPGHAATPCPAGDTTPDCRYAKGLLWKIERPGQKSSHLFGTIHLSDARVVDVPPPVLQRLDAAASFTMEVVFDAAVLAELAEAMFFHDERTLASVLGARRYDAVKRALARHGTPLGEPSKHKPWVVATQLTVPPQDSILDLELHARATRLGKPVHGLESAREQIDVFDQLAMSDQIALLDGALAQHTQLALQIEEMVRAYLARDLRELVAIVERQRLADARTHERIMERLLGTRNRRMAERMQARLIEGNAFIAIGALHLPGEGGVLALLERAGWRVTPVY